MGRPNQSAAFLWGFNPAYSAVNVKTTGARGDGIADDTAAIQAAIDRAVAAGGPSRTAEVFLPPGTYRLTSALTLPGNITLRGAGRASSRLHATGTAPALRSSTPGVRVFDWHLADFSIIGNADMEAAIELEDVSTSQFERITITGVSGGSGIRVSGAAEGNSVYNTFYDVQVNGGGGAQSRGFDFLPLASNEHRIIACRAFNCNRGVSIEDCNGNRIIASAFEANTIGVRIAASASALSDANNIVSCRFEGETTAIQVVSANVRFTTIVAPHFTSNGTDLSDGGLATQLYGAHSLAGSMNVRSLVQNRGIVLERVINGGAELPAVVLRDGVTSSGDPVTLQVETERASGFFFRGRRGNDTFCQIDASGRVFPGGDAAWISQGTGSPEGAVVAPVGALFLRTDGGAGTTLYVKESGGGTNAGWVAK